MTSRVELPPALAAAIGAAAQAAFPGECCGLVEGFREAGGFRITAIHPARNLCAATDRFELDPRDHIAAQKAARANGHVIIGCYHSHPGGVAKPSPTDLAGADQADFLWLVAAGGELAAFVYCDGVFRGCVTGADWVTSSS